MAKAANKTAKKAAPPSAQKTTSAPSGSEVAVKAGKPVSGAVSTPFQELERVFEDFLNRRWPRQGGWEWPRWGEFSSLTERQLPSVDIVDGEKEIVVRAQVPGIDKKDLDVSIVERTLTIKGSTRTEEKEEKDNYFRQEIKTGAFSRSVLLPADVNASKATASFKAGVLELHLPKTRSVKPQKVPLTS
jgi:HSP20 family protein